MTKLKEKKRIASGRVLFPLAEYARQIAALFELLLRWMSWGLSQLATGVMIAIVGIVVVSIVARSIFRVGILDAVTMGRIACTLIVFCSIAWTYRQDKHIMVKVAVGSLPKRALLWINVIALPIVLIVFGVMVFLTSDFAIAGLQIGEVIKGVKDYPSFPFQIMIGIGLLNLSFEILRRIIKDVTSLSKGG